MSLEKQKTPCIALPVIHESRNLKQARPKAYRGQYVDLLRIQCARYSLNKRPAAEYSPHFASVIIAYYPGFVKYGIFPAVVLRDKEHHIWSGEKRKHYKII